MNTISENTTSTDNRSLNGKKQSPPAFLDLADSAARLGTNLPDLSARVELKRQEHQRQRAQHLKSFEDQMRALEHQQVQELLSIPLSAGTGNSLQHLAVSAPTTPPRMNAVLHGEGLGRSSLSYSSVDDEVLSRAVGSGVSDKRKSVTYAPVINSPELLTSTTSQGYGRPAGAKSMPVSRRTSASSHDEELAGHLQGLSLAGERSNRASPIPGSMVSSVADEVIITTGYEPSEYRGYNVGMMLDEQLDQEMHNAMRNLPTSDDDKFHSPYINKMTTSSAALDLAHLSQTSPRSSTIGRPEKASEWPQYVGNSRVPEGIPSRNERRNVTNPTFVVSSQSDRQIGLGPAFSPSPAPHVVKHSQMSLSPNPQVPSSRRGSPSGILDGLSVPTRSVPATPLTGMTNGMMNGAASHLLKAPASPLPSDIASVTGRLSSQGLHQHNDDASEVDVQSSLSRQPSGQYGNSPLTFGSSTSGVGDLVEQYNGDEVYGLEEPLDDGRYNSYGYEANGRTLNLTQNGTSGSTALYHHNGSRYGLGVGARVNGPDSKMNGLHGPKHKRGDADREFNRFAGTRLEDLQGEIPTLCKDQHGCRYLQKKLEEGVPEHRDMIFRETFGRFAELMTDPFGNYLCQKLLEFSTDDQRNVICESVAQDLVTISLNMHGTRAVQKMIDFLSTRRQADNRYNTQIHSIIVALSLHVVVLIKDLNGNHVIQKCLNKLAPEDNQFIYNAVAANCVEVATHRHGCCVLQRCIDHASDHQRVQLVNEITYNALTLVQDPYGNYVVQYILDLNDSRFSDGVIRQFAGNVCALAVQKFSSNVIEKCIRVAEHSTRKMLIEELLNRARLEKLLRDSYGNYCVQTALDYADPQQRAQLVDGIRPVLPLIRNTPYGKRIQNKLQREQLDQFGGYHQGPQSMSQVPYGNHGGNRGRYGNGHNHRGRHGSNNYHHQQHHAASPMADPYATQNGVYGLATPASYGQAHLGHAQTIEAYTSHSQSLTPSHSLAATYTGVAGYPNVNHFGNIGHAGSLNDPYQRTGYAYGM